MAVGILCAWGSAGGEIRCRMARNRRVPVDRGLDRRHDLLGCLRESQRLAGFRTPAGRGSCLLPSTVQKTSRNFLHEVLEGFRTQTDRRTWRHEQIGYGPPRRLFSFHLVMRIARAKTRKNIRAAWKHNDGEMTPVFRDSSPDSAALDITPPKVPNPNLPPHRRVAEASLENRGPDPGTNARAPDEGSSQSRERDPDSE